MPPSSTPTPALEETCIVPPTAGGTITSDPHARIELVLGSGPQLEAETQALLRLRLRAATIVLLLGVGSFLIRDLILGSTQVRVLQISVAALLALALAALHSWPKLSLTRLRGLEVAVFVLISVFLAVYQYTTVLAKAREGSAVFELAAVKSSVLYVFAVMLLYGTFIPNTWQRAARLIIPMAISPTLVTAYLRFSFPEVRELAEQVANFEQISDHVIMLTLGAIASIYGTHIIHSLRVAAFEARQMGQYHLQERIGAGGMGEVYLAEHSLLKRPCAIKLIRPGTQTDPEALARFEREVRTTAKLSHWNTIDVYDYGRTEDGTFFYVMEYLPGLSLADLVKRYGPLPAGRAIHLLRQTCHALREAHEAGLIHRDIKPANIFAARLGGVHDVAKLLDFGLVQKTADDETPPQLDSIAVSGTPLYMSPEQAAAPNALDARCDIYALGATAYFLLAGRPPFEGTSAIQLIRAHAHSPVVPPSQFRPDIPADLERVVLRCLAKNPDDRYPDVSSLDLALGACADAHRWTDADAARWWNELGESTNVLSPQPGGDEPTLVPGQTEIPVV